MRGDSSLDILSGLVEDVVLQLLLGVIPSSTCVFHVDSRNGDGDVVIPGDLGEFIGSRGRYKVRKYGREIVWRSRDFS